MNMNEQYKRRIRIEGGMDDVRGRWLIVRDLETGEEITNVTSAVVYLHTLRTNTATLTYHEMDEHNHVVKIGGDPLEKEIELSNMEIAVTALRND